MLIAALLAVLAGISRTVGRMTNARLAGQIGLVWSTFANYLVGLTCSLVALALTWQQGGGGLVTAGPTPAWAYLGAAVGVLFVLLSNLVTPRLPAFAMTVLLVLGQLAAGLAIDWLTGSPLSIGKVAGCILILASLLVNGKPRSTNLQQTSAPAHNT